MKLDLIISRFDDTIYDTLLGGSKVIKIVKAIEEKSYDVDSFSNAFKRLYTDQEMLEVDTVRHQIIDVLRNDEIQELARRACIKGNAELYSKIKKLSIKSKKNKILFFTYFEVDFFDIENDREYLYSHNIDCLYPLFDHQRKAIQQITSVFHKDNRVLLHMPTGSGKTRTAANIICEHMRLNEPTIVVWLANAEELCEQTYNEITSGWKKIGNRSLNFIKYYGGSKEDITSINDGVIVAGLQKLNALLDRDSEPITTIAARTSLVIIDEAHITVAETYKGIVDLLVNVGRESNLLGLSATPGRTWNDRDEDRKLSDIFKKNKVTLRIEGYNNPIDYLVAEKYLAKVDYESLYYDGKIDITENDINNIQEHLRLSKDLINKLSRNNFRNISIINKIKSLVQRHRRIIVFAMTVEHSIILATALQLLGINAFSITTKSSSLERKNKIDEYNSDNDETIILCNYGILTTGFDAPKTSCAVITRPTDSLVLYSQMVGRAIRGPKAGGNEKAEIITVIDRALPGFESVGSAFLNWEDVWE